MNTILYKQENSKIAIMSIAPDVSVDRAKISIPTGTEYCVVDNTQLPSESDLSNFFDALSVDFKNTSGPVISIDIIEARNITKDRLRRERVPLFEANDILIRDAMIENNTEKLSLAIAERDRLRDITLITDTINTTTELKNLHP